MNDGKGRSTNDEVRITNEFMAGDNAPCARRITNMDYRSLFGCK